LFGSSIFAAPALGALLLTHTGPNPLFVIDAATFVVSGALVATLPSGRAHRQAAGPIGSSKLGTVAGLRLAFRSPVIRGVAAANFASGAAVTVTQAFLVVGAHEHFGGDAAVGYLYAGVGLGSTIGGLLALRATPPRHWTHAAVFLVIVASLVALAAFSASSALAPALIFLALSAATGSSFDIWGATEVQRRAPPGYMGRFNSVIWVAQYSGMLLGALWALGTSTFLHWDLAVQIACDAMLVLVTVVWLTGPREAQPVPVAAESVALPDPQSRVSA
jgi:predicted MFS family arabinose efflux permease